MRNLFCLLSVALFMPVLAQQAISVNFREYIENPEVAGMLTLLDASQVTATLHADSLDAEFYEIWMVECTAGECRRTKLGFKNIEPDSTSITFTAVAKDSLTAIVSVVHLSAGSPRIEVKIPSAQHTLIGCDYEWKFSQNDTIPLVGYATGIPIKYNLGNGKIVDAFHICGLRFSKVRPSEWSKKYGLKDYLYFEAVPVKERNFNY